MLSCYFHRSRTLYNSSHAPQAVQYVRPVASSPGQIIVVANGGNYHYCFISYIFRGCGKDEAQQASAPSDLSLSRQRHQLTWCSPPVSQVPILGRRDIQELFCGIHGAGHM